jgi:hypothetical protein
VQSPGVAGGAEGGIGGVGGVRASRGGRGAFCVIGQFGHLALGQERGPNIAGCTQGQYVKIVGGAASTLNFWGSRCFLWEMVNIAQLPAELWTCGARGTWELVGVEL